VQQRYKDILAAYEALYDLKRQGKVQAIGVGAKDWKIIQRITDDVKLDWIMIANSMTIKHHPEELLNFMQALDEKGIIIINSAVFHSGFLIGSNYFDYKLIEPGTPENEALFCWREAFFAVCKAYNISPAAACVQFALHAPGVKSIALSTTNVKRIKENLELADADIPIEFWETLHAKGLIEVNFFNKLQPIS
jgi:D-threo-aldose 1-dehydrogenase